MTSVSYAKSKPLGPVLAGSGKRLFKEGGSLKRLKLLSAKTTRNALMAAEPMTKDSVVLLSAVLTPPMHDSFLIARHATDG